MGAECVRFFAIIVCCLLGSIQSYPIEKQVSRYGEIAPSQQWTRWTPLLAFAFAVSCVLLVIGCLNCCRQRSGFKAVSHEEFGIYTCVCRHIDNKTFNAKSVLLLVKSDWQEHWEADEEFTNPSGVSDETHENGVRLDFVNPLQNAPVTVQPSSTYSIFSSIAQATGLDRQPESIVTFEPLPRVLPNKYSNLKSSKQLFANVNDLNFSQDWLADRDFPRQQLHYLRECGQGWFGKVVEGEARGILPSSNKVYRVVVRILKEDASAAEQAFFLQEAKPFKDLSHPNVLKLLGKCLENVPFLLMFETCSNGDLKTFLKQNTGNKEALIYQGIVLRMSVDIASGLSYMLQNGFVHTDIAARNCLVTGDLRIKVGDYGTSLYAYKEEYYFNGDIALPIRWCAPETLNCTETTIEPKQVTGASCIWSFGVLLWELEEWGELPYRDLTDEQVINRVFGAEGLRLSYPANKTPYSQEICSIMTECWKDYIDRPSFIHVMNSLSALLHRFKSNDFDARWYSSKPNTVPAYDNEEKLRSRLASSLFSKCDNDSGIDLDNPAAMKSRRGGGGGNNNNLCALQLQPTSSSSSRQRSSNDDFSVSESPASSRRFSGSSAGDLFASPLSAKLRSPSLENLHGSLSSLNRRADDVFEGGAKLDFQLGLVSSGDASILWNNKPLFQSDSYLEENSILKRVCGGADSLSATDAEEELWRKRIERGEFTDKVKEKSKSVADLMVLTHIDCSESSESDSLPSFHSRQSSFNRQCRRASSKAAAAAVAAATAAPMSLLNSLSFGSESNLPVVEKDQEFQDTLKKIQMAKISGDEETLNLVSLQAMNSMMVLGGRAEEKDGKASHFLANEASEKKFTTQSSHINYAFCDSGDAPTPASAPARPLKTTKLPLLRLFEDDSILASPSPTTTTTTTTTTSPNVDKEVVLEEGSQPSAAQEVASDVEVSPCGTNDEFTYMSSCSSDNVDSVVIGPCESHTLEYFKGLKTTLVEQSATALMEASAIDELFATHPQTLNEFLSDASGDYFYRCVGDEAHLRESSHERAARSSSYICDFCYQNNNECLRCGRDRSVDENCSCESPENAEKCPFQSDDSGRGTDQINSGDGSSDKSLEGSISVQMNEVKNRLDVIAKFSTVVADEDASDDNCSSLEEDKKELEGEAREQIVTIEELDADDVNGGGGGALLEVVDVVPMVELEEAEEEEEHSMSADEDTCPDTTVIDSSTSNKSVDVRADPSFVLVGAEDEKQETDPELSKSCDSLAARSVNSADDLTYDVVTDSVEASLESEASATKSNWTEATPTKTLPPAPQPLANSETAVVYEISDILEGLSEPVSLSYSVNEEDADGAYAEDCIPSTWLPTSLEDSSDEENDRPRKRSLHVDQSVVEAIRNELRQKLPAVSSTLALSDDLSSDGVQRELAAADAESTNEAAAAANANIMIEYNAYQAQLSPILEEEDEDAYSPFSSVRSLASSYAASDVSSASETINASTSCTFDDDDDDDLLTVNMETNEASLFAQKRHDIVRRRQQQQRRRHSLNETYEIGENDDDVDDDDDTIGLSDPLDSDSATTPDSLSPATSSKTSGAHLSYSSSDCGNLSDVFLSPSSSSKNFDLDAAADRSPPDDARLLNTPENTLRLSSSADGQRLLQPDHQRTIFDIDEMLKHHHDFSRRLGNALQLDERRPTTTTTTTMRAVDGGGQSENPPWLRSFFTPANEVASLISFHSLGDDETQFRSLPADFKTECWPTVNELTCRQTAAQCEQENDDDDDDDSEVVTASVDLETSRSVAAEEVMAKTEIVVGAEMAEKVYVSENETSSSESSQNVSLKSGGGGGGETQTLSPVKERSSPLSPSSASSSSRPKSKNSIALFGNGPKQIRNFYVSLVDEDSLASATKTTKPTECSYWSERLAVSSSADSKKTWKSPATVFGSYLGSPTYEGNAAGALHEDKKEEEEENTNDMLMSTSFIESDSQESSVDGREEGVARSDDDSEEEEEEEEEDDDGVESTSEEFVWKENNDTDIAQNDKTFTIDNELEDGEEDDADDDDDERLADFVPFSWNSDATPEKSSLKAKDRININKKNVSFKKQKYHCVYEYPKEEPHYACIYDNMLQERMLSLWNVDRDYLYNDYSSFSDWELDDCGEEASPNQNNDDRIGSTSAATALNTSRPTSIANKLAFYTIGAPYDLDATKSEDSPPDYPIQTSAAVTLESPSPSSPSPYSTFASSSPTACSSASNKHFWTDAPAQDWSPIAESPREEVNSRDETGGGTSSTLALGELKHTKNRLKLDLNNTITSYKSSTAEQQSKSKKYEADDDTASCVTNGGGSGGGEENDADDFVNEYHSGLKFKSCDISPVVELQSLTSTSVA